LRVEGGRGLDAVDVGGRRHGLQPHVAVDAAQRPIVVGVERDVFGDLADAYGKAVFGAGFQGTRNVVGELREPAIVAPQRCAVKPDFG